MSTEKIGIILATYNPNLEHLEKQLKSIQRQTWTQWVCHICDDASSFNLRNFLSQYTQQDQRFICHFHQENVGVNSNFERGLRYLQNDPEIAYIAFCDQDDIWQQTKLIKLREALARERAILAHSDLEIIDAQGKSIYSSVWQYENRQPEKLTPKLLLLRNTVTGCTMMFSRNLLRQILPFPKQNKPDGWYHDHWVALVAAHHGKIVHIRESLVKYRQHDNNTVGTQKDTGTIRQEFVLWLGKRGRLTLKSYKIHCNLSKAFYQRFYPYANQNKINPFSEQPLDFGFSILKLGIHSALVGYGSQGNTLRLVVNKFIFDCLRIKGWLLRQST
ncbi:MAG: glycosyltransferase family 2 protein [Spirulinaceae cyanobacterium]